MTQKLTSLSVNEVRNPRACLARVGEAVRALETELHLCGFCHKAPIDRVAGEVSFLVRCECRYCGNDRIGIGRDIPTCTLCRFLTRHRAAAAHSAIIEAACRDALADYELEEKKAKDAKNGLTLASGSGELALAQPDEDSGKLPTRILWTGRMMIEGVLVLSSVGVICLICLLTGSVWGGLLGLLVLIAILAG